MEHSTLNWCIFCCCAGVSALMLGNRYQIYRDILWLLLVPVIFTGVDCIHIVPNKSSSLWGGLTSINFWVESKSLGIIVSLYKPLCDCAFKSREKPSTNLFKPAGIMFAVCILPGLTLTFSTLHDPRDSSLGCLCRQVGRGRRKKLFQSSKPCVFHWKWSMLSCHCF